MTRSTFTVFLTTLAVSQTALSQQQSIGARYLGQGGAMTANGNDSFVLAVNPANLLSHGKDLFAEVALNASQNAPRTEQETESSINSYAGFVSTEDFTIGYFSNRTVPSITGEEPGPDEAVFTSHSGVALALGNAVEWNEDQAPTGTWLYGAGAIYDMASADFGHGRLKESGMGHTFAGKVSYSGLLSFRTQALDYFVSTAVSVSNEIVAEERQAITLRPDTKRAGVTFDIAHLNQSLSWKLALSADVLSLSSTYPMADTSYTLGNALQLGAEWVLIQPFGVNGDFAIRAGSTAFEEHEQALMSAGLGFSYGLWALDFSVSEHDPVSPTRAFNLSITKTFD